MFGSRRAVSVAAAFLQMAFDTSAFANLQVTEANDDKYTPVPEGEYQAVAKFDMEKGFRTTDKGSLIMDVQWKIDDPQVTAVTGLKEPTVRQSIFLDTTEGGGLDMGKGKNVKLGQLRTALGLNVPGQTFQFGMIDGRPAKIKVKHRIADGETYTDVKEVTKL